jgi:hypothetical protein
VSLYLSAVHSSPSADAELTRSLSLMRMCDKNMQQEDATVLESIHGYLESRLLLLNNIKVRFSSAWFPVIPRR